MARKVKTAFSGTSTGFGLRGGRRPFTFCINSVEIPTEGMNIDVTIASEVGSAGHLKVDLVGDFTSHLDVGELGRMYADDPIVQALLSYMVRAELLYAVIKAGRDDA